MIFVGMNVSRSVGTRGGGGDDPALKRPGYCRNVALRRRPRASARAELGGGPIQRLQRRGRF